MLLLLLRVKILNHQCDHYGGVNEHSWFQFAQPIIAVFSEGRKRKFRKFLLPLLLLGKLKAAVEIPAILTIVSLIAFKGVGVGLVALILASVALFKAFANGHLQTSSKLSYEIVPQVAAPALQWSRTAPQAFEPWPTQGYHGIPGIGG